MLQQGRSHWPRGARQFAAARASAVIYGYDNNSSDGTRAAALAAGASVRVQTLQGKGNVVRRMFTDIAAEVCVLVDGDGTYEVPSAAGLFERLLTQSLDMVNGSRVATNTLAFRPGRVFGNKLLTGPVAMIFGARLKDMLSGYRVMSHRFVKSLPALASGFETEAELTVHALELRLPIAETDTPYRDRPPGSASKLRTFHDGFRILRPLLFLV